MVCSRPTSLANPLPSCSHRIVFSTRDRFDSFEKSVHSWNCANESASTMNTTSSNRGSTSFTEASAFCALSEPGQISAPARTRPRSAHPRHRDDRHSGHSDKNCDHFAHHLQKISVKLQNALR